MFVGSGASLSNVGSMLATADGIIVASSLKRQGLIDNPVDVEKVRALVTAARQCGAPAR
jgi:predicted TIM-barrel enzyme